MLYFLTSTFAQNIARPQLRPTLPTLRSWRAQAQGDMDQQGEGRSELCAQERPLPLKLTFYWNHGDTT